MGRHRLALGGLNVRIAAIFPGQGSQKVGMGGDLATASPATSALFAEASERLGFDLATLLREGPEDRLRETQISQPAIFVVNYALATLAGEVFGPVVSAGHSFAEFCSLTLARSLSFGTALGLVIERGLAMQDAAARVPGAMSAVLGLDEAPLRAAVAQIAAAGGIVKLANFNAPGQIVISGEAGSVRRAGELAKAAGAKKIVPLSVSGAWHSELMRPARERFEIALAAAPIAPPDFTVISSVDAEPYGDVETIRRNLGRSVTDEVLWHRTAERLVACELDAVVEFGGSAVLAPMMKRLPGAPRAFTVSDPPSLTRLLAELATV